MRAWLLLLVAGCYSPGIGDRQFTCVKSDSCPAGFQCICHVCRNSATTCDEDLAVSDAAPGDLSSLDQSSHDLNTSDLQTVVTGCSAGARSPEDRGRANAALCPAAWLVPGTNSASTPCNRTVGVNGLNGATHCAIEDACSVGWHVCTGDADLIANGFTAADCLALDGVGSLWVTRQQGQPPAPSPGPPQCMAGVDHSVFGCGTLSMGPAGLPTCTVVRRVLTNPPDAVDDCANVTSNKFLCGTSGGSESQTVYKPDRSGGGVICCHD